MRRVFQPRLFAHRLQQRQKRTPLVIPIREQAHVHLPVLDSKPDRPSPSTGRISLGVSLTIHLLLFLFALFYVIDKQCLVEESHFAVDITHYKRQWPRRRRRVTSRTAHTASVRKTTTLPRVRHAITTAVQIPVAMGEPMLLSAALLSEDEQLAGAFQGWEKSQHRAIVPPHQGSAIPPVTSPISTAPSRLGIMGPLQAVQVDTLELNSLDLGHDIIPLSEATRPPRFIRKVVPEYPPLAKRAGKEGAVILTAEIGVDGKARNIKVVQGLGYGCDEAAIVALRAARFFPAYKGKHPVAVRIQIPYRFKIEEK